MIAWQTPGAQDLEDRTKGRRTVFTMPPGAGAVNGRGPRTPKTAFCRRDQRAKPAHPRYLVCSRLPICGSVLRLQRPQLDIAVGHLVAVVLQVDLAFAFLGKALHLFEFALLVVLIPVVTAQIEFNHLLAVEPV